MKIPQWLVADSRSAVVGIVVAAALGFIFAAVKGYGLALHLALPIASAGAVLLVAAIAVTWNQLEAIGERRTLSQPKELTDEEIADRIRTWLLGVGYQIRNVADADNVFNILATDPSDVKVNILKSPTEAWVHVATEASFETGSQWFKTY